MAYIGTAYIVMAYGVDGLGDQLRRIYMAMARIVMAYIAMACVVMAYIVMAYTVMAYGVDGLGDQLRRT